MAIFDSFKRRFAGGGGLLVKPQKQRQLMGSVQAPISTPVPNRNLFPNQSTYGGVQTSPTDNFLARNMSVRPPGSPGPMSLYAPPRSFTAPPTVQAATVPPAVVTDPALIGSELDKARIIAAGGTPATAGASAPVPPAPPVGADGLPNFTFDTLPKNASVADDGKVYENGTGKVLGTYTKPVDNTRFNPNLGKEGALPEGITQIGGSYYIMQGNQLVEVGKDLGAAVVARDERDRQTNLISSEAKKRELFEKQQEEQFGALKTRVQEQADVSKGEEGAKSTVGRAGSMGFSSAELGIIQGVQDKADERIAELDKEKREALRNYDYDAASRKDAQIEQERQTAKERENTLFNRLFQQKGQTIQERQIGLQEKAQTATEANQVRDNALNTTNALFSQIKEGSLDASNLDQTQLATLETQAGLPTGTISQAVKKMGPKGAFLGSSFTKYGGYIIKQDKDGNVVTEQVYGALPSGGTGTGSTLTSKQQSTFLRISDNYQKDTQLRTVAQGEQMKTIAQRVLADPKNAASQLSLLYTFIKALDPNTAVREGEINLANNISSYVTKFGTQIERIVKGKTIADSAARSMANETLQIVGGWDNLAQKIEAKYAAQANVSGVGAAWNEYKDLSQLPGDIGGEDILRSPDGSQEVNLSDLTPAEIEEAKAAGWQ